MQVDTETIERAIQGNESAQRTLYEVHYVAAFRLAYLLLQDTCDAEEVVQDAFVYVFRNLHRYDAERATFMGWLRVVLVSRCRNKRRRRQLSTVSLEMLTATGQPPPDAKSGRDPADALELQGTRQVIWEALQRVSSGAREALILRYYEGLPYAEISALLGCSPDAARARVAHGKVQLRQLLAEAAGDVVRDAGVVRSAEAG